MVNPLPLLQTVPTETWVEATWEDFLTFADDPTLVGGKFYYDQGYMRVEMSSLGSAHGQDNTILSTVINLYAALNQIPIKGLTNTTFRKPKVRESQPDLAFYLGANLRFPPRNNAPVNLDELDPPTLVVEIAASSLEDDRDRKQRLYQRLGVLEYWVVDVNTSQVIAMLLAETEIQPLCQSQALPGLEIIAVAPSIRTLKTKGGVGALPPARGSTPVPRPNPTGYGYSLVEEALTRSHTEDDGAISRWLLQTLNP